jgi:hypothetical protein
VLCHTVYEKNFAALGLDREAFVRLDAAFRGHKGRFGEDNVGELVPAVLRSESVIFVYVDR